MLPSIILCSFLLITSLPVNRAKANSSDRSAVWKSQWKLKTGKTDADVDSLLQQWPALPFPSAGGANSTVANAFRAVKDAESAAVAATEANAKKTAVATANAAVARVCATNRDNVLCKRRSLLKELADVLEPKDANSDLKLTASAVDGFAAASRPSVPVFKEASQVKVNVSLSVLPNATVDINTLINVTCGTTVPGVAKHITMTFLKQDGEKKQEDISIVWRRESAGDTNDTKSLLLITADRFGKFQVKGRSGECNNATKTLKICFGAGDSLSAIFHATPKYADIRCSAMLLKDLQPPTPRLIPLNIRWQPKVIRMGFMPKMLWPGTRATIICICQLGHNDTGKVYIDGSKAPIMTAWTDDEGYTQVSAEREMWIKLTDNGKKINCSIGESSLHEKLDVKSAPKINIRFPNDNATVAGGTIITCSADANPEAYVYFKFLSGIRWITYLGSRRKSTLTAPMKPGNYKIQCVAFNIVSKRTQSRSFRVIIPTPTPDLNLGGSAAMTTGTTRRLICSYSSSADFILYMHFEARNLTVQRTAGARKVRIIAPGLSAELAWFPQSAYEMTVSQQTVRNCLVVYLKPDEIYNRTGVTCIARSRGLERKKQAMLSVARKPSVLGVVIQHGAREPNVVVADKRVVVNCTVDLGNPAVPLESVRGSIRDYVFMMPSYWNYTKSEYTSFGASRHEVLWKIVFSKNDNGTVVKCQIGNDAAVAKVRVVDN